MLVALVVLFTLAETPFGSSVDRALNSVQSRNWNDAITALDQAWMGDPTAFEANNLYYLRGRTLEEQQDWTRALEDFSRIDPSNPLRSLAAWHGARAAMKLDMAGRAEQLIDELPSDFPVDLRMQLVGHAPPALALKIVDRIATREARFQKANLMNDAPALWALLRERNYDDAAVGAARQLAPMTTDLADLKDLATAFMAQRHFDEAESAYQRVAEDPRFSAEAQYQLARIQFFRYDYARAAEGYRAVAAAYPGSNWERDAQYQVGNSLWRLRKYDEAEKAYLLYLSNYKTKPPETAVRDLIDIYRAMGQPAKAIALIDRTLTTRPSVATRQVLLFTKAKILYIQGKFATALQVIRQLKGSRLQNTAGGTSSDELVYFEALCLQKTGDAAAAKAAWQRLARTPDSYYGQLALERLGTAQPAKSNGDVCANKPDRARDDAVARLAAQRRPLLTEAATTNDTLTELMFLQLWDEASLWIDQGPKRPNPSLAADLQYAAGRFNRAITYADRLPASNGAALSMRYPAGYREAICKSAMQNGVDPLWLHAIIWQESKYNPSAQSGAAARGLMQFIPDTAQVLAQPAGIANLTLDMLYNPETSIQLGAYYWATLLQEFKSPQLALAAYNAGPDNVRRWQDKWPGSDGEFFVADIGFTETKRYVQAVSSARMMYGRIN